MNKITKLIGTIFLGISLLVGCSSGEGDSSTSIKDETNKEVVEVMVEAGTSSYSSLTEMISSVKPSVVDVTTTISNTASSRGSGVIIGKSSDGYYIITNHHVIDSGKTFEVTVYQEDALIETKYEAKLIGGSPSNDIAVLKVTTNDAFKVATFIDDSDKVKVGTEVVAIGNPLGILGGTVTKGIISATAREVYIDEIGYMKLLQTDAAINSGNSGGALFNEDGLLVGIVNSGYSSYEGLNFAIPANQAKASMESLIETYNINGEGNYGYVVGETNVGLTLDSTVIYTNNTLKERINVVYAKEVSASSDASKSSIYSLADLYSGTSNYFYAINAVNGTSVTDATTAQELIDDVTIGDVLTLNVTKISYSRYMMGQILYYLDGNSFDVSINVSQYIYTLPN